MVEADFTDIMLTNSLVDVRKPSRLMELDNHPALAITADSDQAVKALSRVARIVGRDRLLAG